MKAVLNRYSIQLLQPGTQFFNYIFILSKYPVPFPEQLITFY